MVARDSYSGHSCATPEPGGSWKLLECGGQIVKSSWFQDCEFNNGRVWVKFGDFDASCVQATKEESSVALFFLRIVQANHQFTLWKRKGLSLWRLLMSLRKGMWPACGAGGSRQAVR